MEVRAWRRRTTCSCSRRRRPSSSTDARSCWRWNAAAGCGRATPWTSAPTPCRPWIPAGAGRCPTPGRWATPTSPGAWWSTPSTARGGHRATPSWAAAPGSSSWCRARATTHPCSDKDPISFGTRIFFYFFLRNKHPQDLGGPAASTRGFRLSAACSGTPGAGGASSRRAIRRSKPGGTWCSSSSSSWAATSTDSRRW
ncbi:hypothetical protein GQ55_9G456500 [Panicum hallii var. hallii]|uniref:Uncharacterized protein n=1 Tax=Panicum hallii var. hallii TaxID=1504633 RepID=A0A2T7CC10_9POAL|nr:hypothetical protein GQ55_9G456500 [Panicum hallii var. hallii]